MTRRPLPSAPSVRPDDRLRSMLARIDDLPTLPEFVTRLLAAVEEPSVSGREIGDIVGEDQAMTAAVLKLVNSPYYGLSRRIGSIQHAVMLLGFRTVRNLALSAVLVKSFGPSSPDARFAHAALWRHAVACAAGSRLLALRLGVAEAEEAFLSGLVHDMGVIVIDQYLHDDFRQILDLVTANRISLREAERQVLGRDHQFVGALLARRWHFPAPVVDAIAFHHQPWRAKRDPKLAAIVHLANAREGDHGFGPVVATGPIPVVGAGEGGPTDDGTQEAGEIAARRFAPGWDAEPADPRAFGILSLKAGDLDWFPAAFAEEWDRARTLVGLLT